MKKILFISGIQLFPPLSGGQLRSSNLCRALAQLGFQVEIYSFTGRKKDYLRLKKSSYKKIDTNLAEFTNRNFLLGCIQFLFYQFNWPPLWLTWFTSCYIPRTLKLKIKECDTIVLDFPYLYPITKYTDKTVRLNTHNAEFELFSDRPALSRFVRHIELKSFQIVSSVFFCNLQDQQKFKNHYPQINQKSFLLPNGIDLSLFQFEEKARNEIRTQLQIAPYKKVFLFTGSQYHPNREAFDFLELWCKTHRQELQENHIVILVVGTVSQIPKDEPHFKVIGKVDAILPYFWASDYGINPITIGSGTNVKMIEFLASKLPILTTPFGARGLKLIDNQSCYYFEREQLLTVIKLASAQNINAKQLMVKMALEDNLDSIDMTKAMNSLNIPW